MRTGCGGGPDSSTQRGQTTLIGFVLLIGMVVVISLSMFLVASGALSDTEQRSEHERIEQSFLQLSHTMASAAGNGDVPYTMDFESGESGAITRTNAGEITITAGSNRTEVLDEPIQMGAVEYEDDGTLVAYQAGGVWRKQGDETQMLSKPGIDYDSESETLTFPIVDIDGDESDLESGTLEMNRMNQTLVQERVADERVFLEVESEYCRGWMTYFLEETSDMSIQEACDEGTPGTVEVGLGYVELEDAFDTGVGISHRDNFDDHKGNFEDATISYDNFVSLTETIRSTTDGIATDEDATNISDVEGTELDRSLYYAEGIDDEELHFNLSDGDALLAVDGDITLGSGEITASCGNELRIFLNGSLYIDGGVIEPTCEDGTDTIQVYGTSDTTANFGQSNGAGGSSGDGPRFEGLLYAASSHVSGDGETDYVWEDSTCDRQVCFQGSPEFTGSIVASSLQSESSIPHGIEPHDGYEVDLLPEEYRPEPITYLNVVHHEVDVRNE